VNACLGVEKQIKHNLCDNSVVRNNYDVLITNRDLRSLELSKIFPSLSDHDLDSDLDGNHVMLLIKSIISFYLKIRKHQICRTINDSNSLLIKQQM
jgi:hypothetical protein